MLDAKTALAYLCLVQLIAAVVYLVLTAGMETPFKAALQQYPHLLAVKSGSATKRRNLYLLGLGLGAAAVAVWRPLD
jgi:hypothetical protein